MAEIKRDIRYINRDFNSFRNALVEYSKTYFPNTYNDFTETSTGMLFMEMASYVGDVLSFYLDNQIQETFIQYARQTENLYNLSYLLGYVPKTTTPSTVEIDVYQTVPAKTEGGAEVPDYDYALFIQENAVVTGVNGVPFILEDSVDFSVSSSLDPTEVSVYELSGATPTTFLLKKKRKAISSTINTTTFTFGTPVKFDKRTINSTNIIGILDVTDSNGNTWYEVPNLAQETVFDTIRNTNPNDPNLSSDAEVPYLLRLKRVQRRFVTRFKNKTTLELQFGAGTNNVNDEELIPNPDNVGLGLPFQKNKLTTAFSPTNFVFNDTYGIAPSNTTLTVRYLTGGGVSSNIPAGTLTEIDTSYIRFLNPNLSDSSLADSTFNSVAVNNPIAADGGSDGDNIEELRKNALGNFQNQLRTVTQADYLVRALSMPARLGTVAKAYTEPAKIGEYQPGELPTILDLYVLSKDINNNLKTSSTALKRNLQTYLSEYRMINDSIKIKDAFIINIGINFDIIVYPNFNSNNTLARCIQSLNNYFNIDKWQINQPILLKELYVGLDKVKGVQTVKNIEIVNLTGEVLGYSPYAYDIKGATINDVVYPSLDPMIFEVKFPSVDIKGRVVPL